MKSENNKETLKETPASRRVKKGEVVFLTEDELKFMEAMRESFLESMTKTGNSK